MSQIRQIEGLPYGKPLAPNIEAILIKVLESFPEFSLDGLDGQIPGMVDYNRLLSYLKQFRSSKNEVIEGYKNSEL